MTAPMSPDEARLRALSGHYVVRMRYLRWYLDLFDAYGRVEKVRGPFESPVEANQVAKAEFPNHRNGDL